MWRKLLLRENCFSHSMFLLASRSGAAHEEGWEDYKNDPLPCNFVLPSMAASGYTHELVLVNRIK